MPANLLSRGSFVGSVIQRSACAFADRPFCALTGMIIPYVVTYSLVFGAIVSNGIMWPLITKHEGNWYPAGLTSQDFRGIFGYKVSSP